MRIIIAKLKSNIHSMFRFHKIYTECHLIIVMGVIKIPIKYITIKCCNCNKVFYENLD